MWFQPNETDKALWYLAGQLHLLQEMMQNMATRQDLDTVIANLGTQLNTSFADLQAKIAAGQVTTPEDFSAEISSLQADLAAAVAADPGPQATTPVATTPDTPAAS